MLETKNFTQEALNEKEFRTYCCTGVVSDRSLAAVACAHGGGPFGLERLEAFSKLPADKQALVISTLNAAKEENKGLRDEIKAAHDKMKEILTAEQFDAAGV